MKTPIYTFKGVSRVIQEPEKPFIPYACQRETEYQSALEQAHANGYDFEEGALQSVFMDRPKDGLIHVDLPPFEIVWQSAMISGGGSGYWEDYEAEGEPKRLSNFSYRQIIRFLGVEETKPEMPIGIGGDVTFGEVQGRPFFLPVGGVTTEEEKAEKCKICYEYVNEYFGPGNSEPKAFDPNHPLTLQDAVDFAHYVHDQLSISSKSEPLGAEEHEGWTLSREEMPPYDGPYLCFLERDNECGTTTKYQMVCQNRKNKFIPDDGRSKIIAWRTLPEDFLGEKMKGK